MIKLLNILNEIEIFKPSNHEVFQLWSGTIRDLFNIGDYKSMNEFDERCKNIFREFGWGGSFTIGEFFANLDQIKLNSLYSKIDKIRNEYIKYK